MPDQVCLRSLALTVLVKKLTFFSALNLSPATPPSEQINKEKIASQIRSRMGRVLDSVDHKVQIFIPFPVVSVPQLPPLSRWQVAVAAMLSLTPTARPENIWWVWPSVFPVSLTAGSLSALRRSVSISLLFFMHVTEV